MVFVMLLGPRALFGITLTCVKQQDSVKHMQSLRCTMVLVMLFELIARIDMCLQ